MTMKRRRRSVAAGAAAAAVLALLVGSTSQASVGEESGERASGTCPVGLRCAFDRDYGPPNSPSAAHKADIYAPAYRSDPEQESPPTILLVHGGGWYDGSRSTLRSEAIYFARNGFASVVIEYTLATEDDHSWPTAVQDVAMASRWIAEHAADYDIDGSNLALFGGSAGGHLATLVAMSADEGLLTGPAPIKTVVSWSGAMLLDPMYADDGQLFLAEQFLGCSYGLCPGRWENASPINHVDANPQGDPDDPSMLFFNSIDEKAPIETARMMDDALEAADIPHQFVEVPGSKHAIQYECDRVRVPVDGLEDEVIDHTVRWFGQELLGHSVDPTGKYCPPVPPPPAP